MRAWLGLFLNGRGRSHHFRGLRSRHRPCILLVSRRSSVSSARATPCELSFQMNSGLLRHGRGRGSIFRANVHPRNVLLRHSQLLSRRGRILTSTSGSFGRGTFDLTTASRFQRADLSLHARTRGRFHAGHRRRRRRRGRRRQGIIHAPDGAALSSGRGRTLGRRRRRQAAARGHFSGDLAEDILDFVVERLEIASSVQVSHLHQILRRRRARSSARILFGRRWRPRLLRMTRRSLLGRLRRVRLRAGGESVVELADDAVQQVQAAPHVIPAKGAIKSRGKDRVRLSTVA